MDAFLSDLLTTSIQKHYSEMVALSDDLAANPEVSGEEFESSKRIVNILERAGFDVQYPFSGYETAFCAELKNGEGPSVAILVEYDALPGIGHACGHNLHGSMSVLAGLALHELKGNFKGNLYVIGTPAEETFGAKIRMARNGVFDKIDFAIMLHSYMGGMNEPNAKFLGLKNFQFKFFGQTAHAAACPWDGRNALTAARKFVDLIDARRQTLTKDVNINQIFTDGGKASNVIPDTAEVIVEFRADSFASIESAQKAILNCAKGAAIAFDCEFEWKRSYEDFADMVSNGPAEKEMKNIMESLGLRVNDISGPLGSSDIGNVSYCCPTLHPMISITDEQCALHTTDFAKATTMPKAHESLKNGAEMISRMVLKVFLDDEFRGNVHRDFEQQIAIKKWI
ncbi:M20 family metallopeptidase [Bacillus sp. UNC41MFS5]|uniref:M20 family metallopeptidase n=1 Tax=Bacillus sp. UNC41MFS5 TaxID=1449046 RepID=UPI000478F657|nr:M20 family metallopeptidase [Bacillus sp. UNC41MFS5]